MECGCRLWVGATDSSSLENYVLTYVQVHTHRLRKPAKQPLEGPGQHLMIPLYVPKPKVLAGGFEFYERKKKSGSVCTS